MKYKVRHDLLLVEKLSKTVELINGIVLPEDRGLIMARFKVLSVGPDITDIKEGNVVLGEDMMEKISSAEPNIGLINQKFIHCIENNNGN